VIVGLMCLGSLHQIVVQLTWVAVGDSGDSGSNVSGLAHRGCCGKRP